MSLQQAKQVIVHLAILAFQETRAGLDGDVSSVMDAAIFGALVVVGLVLIPFLTVMIFVISVMAVCVGLSAATVFALYAVIRANLARSYEAEHNSPPQ
ncbi:hypothetical protein BGX26_011292 [Mortierella sp. AD094]|nr:hypothetical protein BGX26_011292 [Mortierella sp. AD094]